MLLRSVPLNARACAAQVGFLYLRYVGEPRTLWSWLEEFLKDPEASAAPFARVRCAALLSR